ncbi:MAG TPA: hypothetical protein VF108_07345, partial [Actinomycetota bacterium]
MAYLREPKLALDTLLSATAIVGFLVAIRSSSTGRRSSTPHLSKATQVITGSSATEHAERQDE